MLMHLLDYCYYQRSTAVYFRVDNQYALWCQLHVVIDTIRKLKMQVANTCQSLTSRMSLVFGEACICVSLVN